MKNKIKLTIATKTTITAVVVAVFLVGMLVYIMVSLQAYRGTFHKQIGGFQNVEVLEDARLVWTNMRSEEIGLLEKLQSGKQQKIGDKDGSAAIIDASLEQLEEDFKILEASGLDAQQKEVFANIKAAAAEYSQQWQNLKSKAAEESEQTMQAANEFAQWQTEKGFVFADNVRAILNTYVAGWDYASNTRVQIRTISVVVSIVVLVVAALVLFIWSRKVRVPLTNAAHALSNGLDKLAMGDFRVEVPRESTDEVGDMGEEFNSAMGRMREGIRSTVTSAEEVLGVTQGISEGSRGAVEAARRGADYINSGAAAAEQVSRSIQTVAAGAEQMSASIKEIASNANSAAEVAKEASEVAVQTNETVAKLGESSKEIGEVIETITAVAEQTNLLALNATIEAARAGDAGRGFAVVASEVKDLAAETGRATEDVALKVEQIQTDTQAAVSAIEEISNIIASINDYQTTIAAAVEEQTATTNEMSRSVSEAADSSQTIAENVAHIAKQTNELADKFTAVDGRMDGLSNQSRDLASRLKALKY